MYNCIYIIIQIIELSALSILAFTYDGTRKRSKHNSVRYGIHIILGTNLRTKNKGILRMRMLNRWSNVLDIVHTAPSDSASGSFDHRNDVTLIIKPFYGCTILEHFHLHWNWNCYSHLFQHNSSFFATEHFSAKRETFKTLFAMMRFSWIL